MARVARSGPLHLGGVRASPCSPSWPRCRRASRPSARCRVARLSVSFEPNPPGVPRPITHLSSGFNNSLDLYRSGVGGPRRLLMQESYGYSVLDLSNPANPTALFYRDAVPARRAQQHQCRRRRAERTSIRWACLRDGRAWPSRRRPDDTWYTVVGVPNGIGFTRGASFPPNRGERTLVQHSGSRYIAYDIKPNARRGRRHDPARRRLYAAEHGLRDHRLAGRNLGSLAGNYILYQSGGAIRVIDASIPGPIGSITAAYPQTTITSADFGGRSIAYYSAAVDPADADEALGPRGAQRAGRRELAELRAPLRHERVSRRSRPARSGASRRRRARRGANVGVELRAHPEQRRPLRSHVGEAHAADGPVSPLFDDRGRVDEPRLRSRSAVSGAGFALPGQMAGFGVAGTNSVYAYRAHDGIGLRDPDVLRLHKRARGRLDERRRPGGHSAQQRRHRVRGRPDHDHSVRQPVAGESGP